MVAPLLHVGDLGTEFICTVQENNNGTLIAFPLSGYSIFQLEFWNEDLQPYQIVDASLNGDPSAGQLIYQNTSATFINMPGTWRVRPIIKATTPSAIVFKGSFYEFEVEA